MRQISLPLLLLNGRTSEMREMPSWPQVIGRSYLMHPLIAPHGLHIVKRYVILQRKLTLLTSYGLKGYRHELR
jgi:hypothetical protein